MMALMFIMALMATNWELFKKSKSKSEKINLELLDLLASPQVIKELEVRAMLYTKYWEILILGYFCKHRAGEQIYICSPAPLPGWERENSNLDWSIIVKFTLSLFFLSQNMFKNALIPSFRFVL